jgi:RNA polymerase sigma factor (sigma-70 family)
MMTKAATSSILQVLRRVVEDPHVRELPDRDLLQRFHAQQDQVAFHTLLRRHGPMVLDVCCGVLGAGPDADDAFQAAFLVLAQKGGSIRKGASLGSWLHGVAHRIALKARAQSAVRQKHKARAPQRQASEADDLSWREVRQVLHEELDGIAERYREPLVMCYLEGATQQHAAARLGLAERTLRERLERGRKLLRVRLVRRGLGPAAILAVAAWPAASVSAAVSSVLVHSTISAATSVAAGGIATSVVSAKVAALTQGVLRTMFLTKLNVTTVGLLVAGLLVGGVLLPCLCALPQASLAQQPALNQQEKPQNKEPAKKAPDAGQDGAKVVKADDVVKGGKHVNSLAYCNAGKTVAVVIWRELPKVDDQSSSLVLWDLQKGKVEHTLAKFDEGDHFAHVTASKDGTTISAAASGLPDKDATIKVWEAKTGKLVQTLTSNGTGVHRIALSPDGKRVVGSALINQVFVWDVESGKLLTTLETKDMTFWSVARSEDGKFVAAGGQEGSTEKGKVVVWEVETGKVKHEWTDISTGVVFSVVFSPDGKMVAAGGPNEATIPVWDMKTGELKHQLKAHAVGGLAFSPDGKTLASAGWDGKVIVWDVTKEKPLVTLEGHGKHVQGDFIFAIAFAADGRTVASGSWDGTMRFWPVAGDKK